MRYLGVDYGTKKIGIALSDEAGTMGFPRGIVPTEGADAAFKKLFNDERIDAVVIGESKNLDGGDNAVAADARAFGTWIEKEFNVPVYFEDERFSSLEARRQHEPAEKTRAQKSTAPIDDSAAALILTSYLSRPRT